MLCMIVSHTGADVRSCPNITTACDPCNSHSLLCAFLVGRKKKRERDVLVISVYRVTVTKWLASSQIFPIDLDDARKRRVFERGAPREARRVVILD